MTGLFPFASILLAINSINEICRAEKKYLLVEIDDAQKIDKGVERGYAPKREPTPVPPMAKPPSWKSNWNSNWKPTWQANWKASAPYWNHREDKPILPSRGPNWKPTMKPTRKPAVEPTWKTNTKPMGYEPRVPYSDATIPPIPLNEAAKKLAYEPKNYQPYESRPIAQIKSRYSYRSIPIPAPVPAPGLSFTCLFFPSKC